MMFNANVGRTNKPINTWTVEEDDQLVRYRHVDQLRWTDIGARMFRSKTSVQGRYCQLIEPKNRIRLFRRPQWSAEAEAELEKLRYIDKLTFPAIAKLMGRTVCAVADKLEWLRRPPRQRVQGERTLKQFVPQTVLDERDRRMAAERSLSAELCGEPRPGQSALDRKQQGIVDPPSRDHRAEQLGPKPTLAGELV